MEKTPTQFLEQTILTIFLWIGIWGIITLVFEHCVQSFGMKIMIYIIFVIISFKALQLRNHIQ